MTLSGK